jgi:hypothetical protein
VEYLYSLASNSLDNSILRLGGIVRVLIVDIVVVEEEVIGDIEDIIEVKEA